MLSKLEVSFFIINPKIDIKAPFDLAVTFPTFLLMPNNFDQNWSIQNNL